MRLVSSSAYTIGPGIHVHRIVCCVLRVPQFDLGMVYDEADKCFIHKWLLLTDPDDPSSGAKVHSYFSQLL